MSAVGSLAWMRRGDGRLSAADRARVAALGVELRLRLLRSRLGPGGRASLDLETLPVPDSTAARDAEERCAELPPHLAAHSHRAWLWGTALAAHGAIRHDAELLYVACLLHDTGVPLAEGERCFSAFSADVAAEHAARAGWPAARSDLVADVITRHLNPYVGLRDGAEAHLLNAGAALDVVGARRNELADETVAAVLARHPRHDLKRAFDRDLRAHAKAAPACRTAFLYRYGRFGRLVERAPFEE